MPPAFPVRESDILHDPEVCSCVKFSYWKALLRGKCDSFIFLYYTLYSLKIVGIKFGGLAQHEDTCKMILEVFNSEVEKLKLFIFHHISKGHVHDGSVDCRKLYLRTQLERHCLANRSLGRLLIHMEWQCLDVWFIHGSWPCAKESICSLLTVLVSRRKHYSLKVVGDLWWARFKWQGVAISLTAKMVCRN